MLYNVKADRTDLSAKFSVKNGKARGMKNRGGDGLREIGVIRIHLAELLEKRALSKNKLSQRAEMQRTQINHYCSGAVTRLDVDVLARLCSVLNCEIGELLEYVPPGAACTIDNGKTSL